MRYIKTIDGKTNAMADKNARSIRIAQTACDPLRTVVGSDHMRNG